MLANKINFLAIGCVFAIVDSFLFPTSITICIRLHLVTAIVYWVGILMFVPALVGIIWVCFDAIKELIVETTFSHNIWRNCLMQHLQEEFDDAVDCGMSEDEAIAWCRREMRRATLLVFWETMCEQFAGIINLIVRD